MIMSERTTGCGLVSGDYLNKKICLTGWVHRRRDHGGLIFIDLRDKTGLMQLVFNPEFSFDVHELAHKVRSEYVLAVSGTVVKRSPETINKDIATGEWELHVDGLEILNSAKMLPFAIDSTDSIDEELRLKHRYLDLRRPQMHQK